MPRGVPLTRKPSVSNGHFMPGTLHKCSGTEKDAVHTLELMLNTCMASFALR